MNGIYIQSCLSADREVRRLPLLIAHKTSFACLSADREVLRERGEIALPDTGVFIAFKESFEGSNEKYLYEVEKARSLLNDSALTNDVFSTESILNYWKNILTSWDSTYADYPSMSDSILLERKLIVEQINLLNDTKIENYMALQNDIANKIVPIKNENNAIYSNKDYELFERIINDIYMRTIDRDNDEFTEQDMEQINFIANQCPLSGGKAVYEARSLFYLFNDTVYFNDSLLCAQQGMSFRKSNESKSVSSFTVYPNPNQGIFTAKLSDSDIRIAQYKIYNLLGKLVLSAKVNVNEVQIDINSLNISSGFYIVEAMDTNNKIYRKEISYEK